MMKGWLLLAAVVLLFGCDKTSPEDSSQNPDFSQFAVVADMQPAQAGVVAPDFSYTLLDGRTGKLSDEHGKIVMLNFWATWCYPCKREMPDLDKLQAYMKGKPFRLLTVSASQGVEQVAPYTRKFPYPFDYVLDPQSILSELYKVDMLPTTLIIDKNGVILAKAIGPRQWSSPEFFRQMDILAK